jgi:hypothetical protein
LNDFIWLLLLIFALPFGYVLISGAPYIPSKKKSLRKILKNLKVKPGEYLIDLGSGDGTVGLLATREFGLITIGYELNPYLVLVSKIRSFALRNKTKFIVANMWRKPVPKNVDYIYIFQMTRLIEGLVDKIRSDVDEPKILITYAFEYPGHKPLLKIDGYLVYKIMPLDK